MSFKIKIKVFEYLKEMGYEISDVLERDMYPVIKIEGKGKTINRFNFVENS